MDLSRLTDEQLQQIIDSGGTQSPLPQAPSSALAAIHQIESGGASDARADIVNPASGARGSMQVMPDTARSPGFGVRPSNGTPQDDARMGRDYYSALASKYGSPELAAIAYNWGPGNTDKWLKSGADVSRLPTETLNYLVKFGQLMPGSESRDDGPFVPGVSDLSVPSAPTAGSGGALQSLGAGIGEGFGKTMLGAQALIGKGLSAVGATKTGDWLVDDARSGRDKLTREAQEAAGESGWRTAGNFVGAAAPLLVAGPELAPQLVSGGLYGASQGALNDTGILPGAVEGAGLGAGGYLAGKAIGAIGAAARPALAGAWNAVRGGERAAAAKIAGELGADLDPTIAALRTNSDELIPGSLPTAAEAGQNPTLVRIQRQLQNTADGQVAFPARQAANNAARFAEGQRVVGANLADEMDAFTQQQAARVAAGQAELPPLTQAQADAMQSPAYRQAMTAARKSAESRLSTAFEDQQVPLMQSLREGIERVAGTPETIDALKAARGQTADELFAQTDVSVPMAWPEAQQLAQKPAFQDAMRFAQRMSDNLGEGPVVTGEGDGAGTWLSGRGLLYAKGFLDDQINYALQRERNTEARALIAVKNELVGLMDRASPEYAPARAKFQADSAPIDAQQALQSRLNGVVDPLSGVVSPNNLRRAINSITGEQLKPGIRPADQVSPATLDDLRTLGTQARAAPANLVGLNGEGQELMRQALAERVRESADTLMRQDANTAAADFSSYLRSQSPSYAKFFDEAATTGADLQSRQAVQEALQKLGLTAKNGFGDAHMTFQGAKAALSGAGELTGAAKQYAQGLLADLQRSTAANAQLGAAGPATAANFQLGGGLLGALMKNRLSDNTIAAGLATGNFGVAGAAYAVQRAVAKAAARTEKAAIDLLLNPKKLARALEEFKGQPKARQAFVDALKQKASGAGKAGVRAVQAYEAGRQQKRSEKNG
ncbi:lytic transglycosylase domain-containing protein [Burkholderia multivorans]|uniref:Lytic transglycosylase domain-containing protein n=1 Tax=Burkholderia multivorans TaxID=87883 RepID=A0AAP2HLX9_9BURK|nr:lytic transglycosylase domain-containing protein [Burkholderia multivorans]MBU9358912.1 lytic transglycosylase domain-containing protein [Burkholderia multivorans]